MKNKFIILGCGSSLGSPWITNYWGKCNKKNNKNFRTRCCAYFKYDNISVLIDTSPDLKNQILINKIKDIDAVMYTHEHADQSSGIFELRPFEDQVGECIFVGEPQKLLDKYKLNTNEKG